MDDPGVDLDALGVTSAQEALIKRLFSRLTDFIAHDPDAHAEDGGLAMIIATTQFLAMGMEIGIGRGDLSPERARHLVATLEKLLPRIS